MVYCVWIEDVPDVLREHPAVWRERLDRIFEPKLTPEEQAEKDVADAAAQKARLDREWETWGESPEQLAAQQAFMAMGDEG